MKKLIFIGIVVLSSFTASAQMSQCVVDERIELVGVVACGAGFNEYTQGSIAQYQEDVDLWFSPYQSHPVIPFMQKIREQTRLLGYGQVEASALGLLIRNGRVRIDPKSKIIQDAEMQKVWPGDTYKKFVVLLDDFYQKSHFSSFFQAHKPLYDEHIACLNALLLNVRTNWFTEFFGIPFRSPQVYIGMANGRNNYSVPGIEEYGNAIVVGGRPYYEEAILPTVIHEICHPYTDALLDTCWGEIIQDAETVYPYTADMMLKQGYGDVKTAIYEGFNNLFVLMYLQDNYCGNNGVMLNQFGLLKSRGFAWLPPLVIFMKNYYDHRVIYHDISAFMDQLMGEFHRVAADFEQVKRAYENRFPHVLNVFPSNGKELLKSGLSYVLVRFSEPMATHCFSVGPVRDNESYSPFPRPNGQDGMVIWINNHTLMIPVDRARLQCEEKYGILLDHHFYQNIGRDEMEKDYIITFNIIQP